VLHVVARVHYAPPYQEHCASSKRCSNDLSRNKDHSSARLTLKFNLIRCHSHRVGLRDSRYIARRSFRGSQATGRPPITRRYEWHAEGIAGNGSTEVGAPKGALDAHMKLTITMAVLCGLLPTHRVADAPKIERPHWVIIATLIDRSTGQLLGQSPIAGRGMHLTSEQCTRILNQVEPARHDQVAVVLTCERVGPAEVEL